MSKLKTVVPIFVLFAGLVTFIPTALSLEGGVNTLSEICEADLKAARVREVIYARAESILQKVLDARDHEKEFVWIDEFHSLLSKYPAKLRERIEVLKKEKEDPNSVYRYSKIPFAALGRRLLRERVVYQDIDDIIYLIDHVAKRIERAIQRPAIQRRELYDLMRDISFALSYLPSQDMRIYVVQNIHDHLAEMEGQPKQDVKLWSREEFDAFLRSHRVEFERNLFRWLNYIGDHLLITTMPNHSRLDVVSMGASSRISSMFFSSQIALPETSVKLMRRGSIPAALVEGLISYDGVFNRLPFQYLRHDRGHQLVFEDVTLHLAQTYFERDGGEGLVQESSDFEKYVSLVFDRIGKFIDFGESTFMGEDRNLFYELALVFLQGPSLLRLFPDIFMLKTEFPHWRNFVTAIELVRRSPMPNDEVERIQVIFPLVTQFLDGYK